MEATFTLKTLKKSDGMERDLSALQYSIKSSELSKTQKEAYFKSKLASYQKWKKENGDVPGVLF